MSGLKRKNSWWKIEIKRNKIGIDSFKKSKEDKSKFKSENSNINLKKTMNTHLFLIQEEY